MRNVDIYTFIIAGALGVMVQIIVSSDVAKTLRELFEEDWQWWLEQHPELATHLGDHRYNDRLTDLSFEALDLRKKHQREMLDRIEQIDRSQLDGQDLISYDLFLRNKQIEVEEQRWPVELAPIMQIDGPHLSLPHLAASTPFRNRKDYDDYLARLAAYPGHIDQVIELMRRGIERKWVMPAIALRSVPAQIEAQIENDGANSPLLKPFQELPRDLPLGEGERIAHEGRRRISKHVIPALDRLSRFIKETYLPACRSDIAVSSLPDGEAFYAFAVRRHTTTDLTPRQIHEVGLQEVGRIRGEMEAVIEQVGFRGSFQEFIRYLRTDPRFYFDAAEDLVRAYRDISKRADARLPELFAELPRNPYGVREIPAYEAPAQTTAYYHPGAADASRAGYYLVNTYKLETRPKYEMEALSLHEAVPGHHLQVSRAQELSDLPEFRRNAVYTAYVEGWGLYAESLGYEMGFYGDPYSKFGQLTYEIWRACRLVVDTGMHTFGWTRQQGIDLMKEKTAKTENDIIIEIDRYIAWPAQALAYKIGELKIKELKARARRELQERFDARRFHNALLDDGPLPLDLLEKRVDQWIANQKGK